MKTKTSKKQWPIAALSCALLALTSQSNAAVTVTFSQVGANVVATWNGTITPGSFAGDGIYSGADFYGGGLLLFVNATNVEEFDFWDSGVATATLLNTAPSAATGGIYGYGGASFYFNAISNSIEDNPSVDFGTGSTYTMTWAGQTLAGIGASSFNNTLAWTASTGGTNTISFTTVPEPSASLLGLLGAVGLVSRRRRTA